MSVKQRKPGRPVGTQSPLNADAIIACARQLMREQGKVPSIRQVSGGLGVDAMAIYHYFANKAALLEAVTVSLVEDIYQPDASTPWQQQLRCLCRSYLHLLQQHSGLLETLLSMTSAGPAQIFSQRLANVLQPLALTDGVFEQARDLLADYMHGVALAMQCQPQALTLDCIEGPLQLLFNALEQASN